jgi:hypothetical protein
VLGSSSAARERGRSGRAWSRNDILVDQPGKAWWTRGTALPAEPLTRSPQRTGVNRGSLETLLGNFQVLNGHARHPRGLLRYCRRQRLCLTSHVALARPARQPFFLAKSGALPLRIRVPAAVHSQSFTSSNVDQCSAAFAPSAPFSVILDAREKSIAHAESVCALRYTRGPAVTPRLARLFARAPHSACPMSQFALCESGRLNAPVCQVTRRILCDLRTCT